MDSGQFLFFVWGPDGPWASALIPYHSRHLGVAGERNLMASTAPGLRVDSDAGAKRLPLGFRPVPFFCMETLSLFIGMGRYRYPSLGVPVPSHAPGGPVTCLDLPSPAPVDKRAFAA